MERDVLETLESIKDVGRGKVVPDHGNKFENLVGKSGDILTLRCK